MCNAHNHPLNCNCGWGGVWYGGSGFDADWLFRREPKPRRLGFQKGTALRLAGGYTVPNSYCPVCGDAVFYYESPHGGRVFFDSLGPPWPKHPCTSGAEKIGRSTAGQSWHRSGWKPLTSVTIDSTGPTSAVYRLTGSSEGKTYCLHFRAHEIVMAEVVRFKKTNTGVFELSILDYNETERTWASWNGLAYVSGDTSRLGPALTKTPLHAHVAPPQVGNPIPSPPPGMLTCPDCSALVGPNGLLSHLRVQHRYIPLGTMNRFVGRLLLGEIGQDRR